jgi:phosphoribosyl-ATP pyrophosphohydrolase
MANESVDDLIALIKNLCDSGARHKKRGFLIREATPELNAIHLVEEAVEVQAEVIISRDKNGIISESADMLAIWLHLLVMCDITFEEVVAKSVEMLGNKTTCEESEVLTSTPGFTRRNRQDSTELHALFHKLWTANVGTERYDKKKWQELAQKLRDMTGVELT